MKTFLLVTPMIALSVAFSIYFAILMHAARLTKHKTLVRSRRKKAVIIATSASAFVAIIVGCLIQEVDISSGILSAIFLIIVVGIVLHALAPYLMR